MANAVGLEIEDLSENIMNSFVLVTGLKAPY